MQHIYSQAIIAFISKTKECAKQILQCEMNIKVLRERFSIANMRYPLHIVVFEGADMLGYFNSAIFEIGLNKHFLTDDTDLLDTLRHELAHYYCWIKKNDLTHSTYFRDTCRQFGWGTSVYEARKFIDTPSNHKISCKIQKLLALSNSTNPHEAQSALIKANELLLKNPASTNAELAVRRVLSGKRSLPKWHSITEILRTFGVHPVFNRGQGESYLEVFGPIQNVTTAEYIATYLNHEFEILWKVHGKGLKSAFFDGIAKGYLRKIRPIQKPFKPGLIALEKNLTEHLWMPYPHLHQTLRTRKTCPQSVEAGMQIGKNLTIRSPVESQLRHLYLETD
ncbi:MAG: DUF2786 domain-containing protein [Chlamydiales bacterium]|nr:DUF2786 domain-containing protein [Chlamydiales bacterium]